MKLVDTHIHLYEYDDIDSLIHEAIKNNVVAIFCVSEDLLTAQKCLEISKKYYDLVYPLIGIHPWTATYSRCDINEFLEFFDKNADRIIGIGEVGLDRKYIEETSEEKWSAQKKVFVYMIKLAEKYKLPMQVHSRRAADKVLEMLSTFNVKDVQFHWFSDNEKILNRVVERGYYVSFTPSVTYSKRIMKLASLVPKDLILTETDGPVRFFGKFTGLETKPQFVREVIIKLSEILKVDPLELSGQVLENVRRLYKVNIPL